MKSTEPKRGLLDAVGLTVLAEPSGTRTKVTFRSSVAADQATLCRYAALLADPPLTNSDVVRFHELHVSDEDAIARIATAMEIGFNLPENGLASLKSRGVSPKVIAAMMQRAGAAVASERNADSRTPAEIRADLLARKEIGVLNNRAMFRTEADFLEFAVVNSRPVAANMREYKVSMLMPRDAATVATEDMSDAATGFAGEHAGERTRPIRVEATLLYTHEAGTWHLTTADITRIFTIP
jgi:hypothetical protein